MKCWHVDAFAEKVFEGNPAAVCVLDGWPEDALLQAIAGENNLSETAYAVRDGERWRLRWFTPGGEIDLCGHATLGTAFVLANFVTPEKTRFVFDTMSGELVVERRGDMYELDFPAYELRSVPVTPEMGRAIGRPVKSAWMGRDLVCELESEDDVRSAGVDQALVRSLDGLLLHITAPGADYDCVTRSFAPKLGVAEDPVCGSGHCHVAPLWAAKLNKSALRARQASKRGGTLLCRVEGGRCYLAGGAALYSTAELNI